MTKLKREIKSWITINGTHIPIYMDETQDEAVKRFTDRRNDTSTIRHAVHITKEENVNSILNNGFDKTKSGTGIGDAWGSGVYFAEEDLEQVFYQGRIESSAGVEADIDTSNMFTYDFGSDPAPKASVKTGFKKMYDNIASTLPEDFQKEYKSLTRMYKIDGKYQPEKQALIETIQNHYTGFIIKQNSEEGLDIITGGNQIVVYDTSVIKNKKRW